MDLSDFDTLPLATEGVEVPLRSLRTGKDTDARIKVIGQDSEEFAQLVVERARAMRRAAEADPRGETPSPAIVASTIDMLVGCTKGWRNITKDGAPIEYSPAEARKLYAQFPAIREQVNQAITDRVNFLPALSSG